MFLKLNENNTFLSGLLIKCYLKSNQIRHFFGFKETSDAIFFGQLLRKCNLIVQIYTWFFSLHVFLVLEKSAVKKSKVFSDPKSIKRMS